MDNPNLETVTPAESFPIAEPEQSATHCTPCNRDFESPAALSMHNRWAHDDASRKIMLRGVRRTAKNRKADGRVPRLVGRIPNGSKLPKIFECGFCDYPPLSSDSGLRYHLSKEHKVHNIQANRDALVKKHAKQGTTKPEVQHRMPLDEKFNPKRTVETLRSEVVATIEVVRIGTEVYGRIAAS